jgi:hypothetical protein
MVARVRDHAVCDFQEAQEHVGRLQGFAASHGVCQLFVQRQGYASRRFWFGYQPWGLLVSSRQAGMLP